MSCEGYLLVTTIKQPKIIFPELEKRAQEQEFMDNHIIQLIRIFAEKYINVRLRHHDMSHSNDLLGSRMRSKLSRLVIFKGQ